MTATAPADRDAASHLVATQEHAWTAIRTRHPDVSHDVMVVASGSDPCGKRLNLGHFAFGKLIDQATDRSRSWSVAKASAAARRTLPHWLLSCWMWQAGGTATRPGCSSYPGAVLPSTATTVERYFLGLEIYSSEPIPTSGGPA
jgi:hypothetical protein